MSAEQKFLFQSDFNRFWEIVTNDDSKARFAALESSLDDLLLVEVIRYGVFNNQEMIEPPCRARGARARLVPPSRKARPTGIAAGGHMGRTARAGRSRRGRGRPASRPLRGWLVAAIAGSLPRRGQHPALHIRFYRGPVMQMSEDSGSRSTPQPRRRSTRWRCGSEPPVT